MCLGIPAQVVDLTDPDQQQAVVEVAGVRRSVNVGLIEPPTDTDPGDPPEQSAPVAVGDWVLVHVGFALSRIDAEEAAATLAALRRLGSTYEEELASFGAAESVS